MKLQKILPFVLVFCLVLPLCAGNSHGRDIRFQRISLEQGLSQATVHCILRDSRGFMWFCTQDGLNKYDGCTFTVYRHDPENSNSLSSNYILSIVEDADGILWIGTLGGGLNKFSPETETFTRYRHQPDNPKSFGSDHVGSIVDEGDHLWLTTYRRGLKKFNKKSATCTLYKHKPDDPNSLSNDDLMIVYKDSRGNLWVGTRYQGLNKFNIKSETFTRYQYRPDDPVSLSHNRVRALLEDKRGNLWVGTEGGGLNAFDYRTETFTRCQHRPDDPGSLSNNNVKSIYQDRRGKLWIGTLQGGLNTFDPKGQTFTRYRHQAENPSSLSDNYVISIYEDTQNILWIGTHSGINKFDVKSAAFGHYRYRPDNADSLSHHSVHSIYEDSRRNLWVGTMGGGVDKYNFSTHTVIRYRHRPGDTQSLGDNLVVAILEDSRNNMWFGTYGGGFNKFNRESETFTRYPGQADTHHSDSHNFVAIILEGKQDYLWLATAGGLLKFNRESETFTNYTYQADNPRSISSDYVYTLIEDKTGDLWAGTQGGGINQFNKQSQLFTRYMNQPGDPKSLSHDTIYCLFIDADGHLWAGTAGGLNKLNADTRLFSHFREKDGLANDSVYGILEDEHRNLWLSTNKGISKFNRETKTFTNYDYKDGLQSNEFNSWAYFKSSSGRMYFGGVNGYNAFHPHEITPNSFIPPVRITDFLLFNKPVKVNSGAADTFQLQRHINFTKQITLKYTDYIFAFEFAALNYRQPEKNQYKYMLEGLDTDWVETGYLNRRATYTNLSHGTYTFKVKASNDDGFWNPGETTVKIIVQPPPWLSWWAYTLYILAGLALVSRFVQWQRNKVKQKQKEIIRQKEFSTTLEQKVKERTAEVVRQKEELEKLSIVASKSDNAILIMDAEGRIEWINDGGSKLFGDIRLKLKERGNNLADISNYSHIADLLTQCRESKSPVSYQSCYTTPRGKKIWTSTTLTPIVGPQGRVTKLIGMDTDITRIKTAEEAAAHANQAKSEFLARMSHEIRTPMNAVIGFTDMLMETGLDDVQLDFVKTIGSSGEALITLLNDILDFSRIEAGELAFEPIDFDPEIMAFSVCDIIIPRIGSKPVEVLCRIGDRVPALVNSDAGRFRQVLVNLLGNAAKFTHKGEIELSIEVAQELQEKIQLLVKVRDTGIGIAEDKVATVFEAFRQSDGSITRKYGGTGLGLAICMQIAKMMEGDIRVESREGRGSVFLFTSWLGKSKEPPPKPIKREFLAGKKVLVADDNSTQLDIAARILEGVGMQVVATPNPADVIALIRDNFAGDKPVDLCIFDIRMPGIDGYRLTAQIRALEPPMCRLPLLAFTSSVMFRAMKTKESGFDAFLPKPVRSRKLLEMLEYMLGKPTDLKNETGQRKMVTQHSVAEAAKHSIRILLAEDNPVNQKLARFMLQKAGYSVKITENGKEALEAYRAEPGQYDLILMDIQMPEMNGREATGKIRELEAAGFPASPPPPPRSNGEKQRIPIIAMTAESMKGDREKCLAAGMDDYIPKPIKRAIVFEMIKKWVF
ncbi:MAG: response regulator [bacterium]|nr:response regulator [bacterium]